MSALGAKRPIAVITGRREKVSVAPSSQLSEPPFDALQKRPFVSVQQTSIVGKATSQAS